MELALPKGMKARMREAIERAGYTSFNAYVADAVREKYARDMGEEMELVSHKKAPLSTVPHYSTLRTFTVV